MPYSLREKFFFQIQLNDEIVTGQRNETRKVSIAMYTVCPRSSDPILCSKLLYKKYKLLGHIVGIYYTMNLLGYKFSSETNYPIP